MYVCDTFDSFISCMLLLCVFVCNEQCVNSSHSSSDQVILDEYLDAAENRHHEEYNIFNHDAFSEPRMSSYQIPSSFSFLSPTLSLMHIGDGRNSFQSVH